MGNLLGAPVTEKETHSGATEDGIQFGVSSMQGWRVHMEDAHIAETKLYAAELIQATEGGGDANERTTDSNAQQQQKYEIIDLPGHSLFGVFDGHGGTYAAEYSGRNLCRILSRQPKFVEYAKFMKERAQKEKTLTRSRERVQYITSGLESIEGALTDSFIELDKEIAMALQGNLHPDANKPYHSADDANNQEQMDVDNNKVELEIAQQFLENLDKEGDSGTTACVVLVAPQWVVCANAGDSRAVFSKLGNKPVPLSYDHKPDDEEEERRIRSAGGYVAGGRVEGDLAVSRGLGDFRFKVMATVLAAGDSSTGEKPTLRKNSVPATAPGDQKVSPVPDVIIQNRSAEKDEFIVLACDGIWDVQTNFEAVKTVADMFNEGETQMGLAAEELLDTCLALGSKDNMTAIIIRFEGQQIGKGGGVMARRKVRNPNVEEGTTQNDNTEAET